MKNTVDVNGIKFEVSAKLTAQGVKFPNEKETSQNRNMYHNEFTVTIKTENGRTSFKYYGSHNDWSNGVKELSADSLTGALSCFMSDACSGDSTFTNFCSEFGYDEDSRSAERIYKACVKSLDKFNKIAPGADIYEAVNHLNGLETA